MKMPLALFLKFFSPYDSCPLKYEKKFNIAWTNITHIHFNQLLLK